MNSSEPVSNEPTPEAVAAVAPPPMPETPPPLPPVATEKAVAQAVPVVPPSPQTQELSRIAQDLQIRRVQVEAVVRLLDEGNTVPFITRYRKEQTGGLDEEFIRRVQLRVTALRALAERKQTILKSIALQGKLTDALAAAILEAEQVKRLEDLYLPYKQKKRTLASDAKDKGLEPAALAIWTRDEVVANLEETLAGLVNPDKQLNTPDDVKTGLGHIISELIAEQADVRGPVRAFFRDNGLLIASKVEGTPDAKAAEFRDYADFKEPIRMIPPHRILAVNRGESEKVLKVKLECDDKIAKHMTFDHLPLIDHPHKDFLIPFMEDAVDRLLLPSLEREVRREMGEFAQDHGVDIFARNLRALLLKAPLGGKKVLALDPGMRTGCKVAVLDETGNLVEEGVIYPHPPQKDIVGAKRKLEQLLRKYQIGIVAIGNGTGCRETEHIVSDLIAELADRRVNPKPAESPIPQHTESTATAPSALPSEVAAPVLTDVATTTVAAPVLGTAETVATEISTEAAAPSTDTAVSAVVPVAPPPPPLPPAEVIDLSGLAEAPVEIAYVIVNEAGASDYSASPIAKEEFPDLDATVRGTISIGRRLQDPLAELVKVDPQHVGVGLYQHDMKPKFLKESLDAVIESCVNTVGVDLNTASVPLLRHVSGLNQLVAREIVEYRTKNGAYKSRDDLKQVPQMGEVRFTQAAGFLKIRTGADPLDNTWVHPESYQIVRGILTDIGHTSTDLADKAKLEEIREKLSTINPEAIGNIHKLSGASVRDLLDAMTKPGRDAREDRPAPIFRKGVLNLEDLKAGMELKGEILNVVDFGAFVDVGLKDSGLIHISQMANRYIKSPYDVVSVGDVVSVWVNSVDLERKRVSLSLIAPGQERVAEPRPPRGERPPRQDRDRGEQAPRPPREDRPQRDDRPPQQNRPPRPPQGDRPQRPQGDRPGFAPRPPRDERPPQPAMPPRPGQGKPGGLYRGPQPVGTGPAPGGEGAPPPKAPKVKARLSDQQKKGQADLNTFAQLAALLGGAAPAPEQPKEKKKKGKPAEPPATPPAAESPPTPPVETPLATDAPPPAADAPPPAAE
jgi:uncharacterized protein